MAAMINGDSHLARYLFTDDEDDATDGQGDVHLATPYVKNTWYRSY